MRQPGPTDISLLLGQWDGEGGFASRRMADAGELNVSVRGFGKLRWPVSEADARKLCKLARPARHGYKTETRLDKGIRDTWEIGPDHLDIGPVAWPKTLDRHLDRIRRDLGLPRTCRLKADLHNLLIYTPGQFFAPHQDSVKSTRMIGTLVVVLPSRFSGGELIVEHRGESLRASGSARELTLIAFYADCRHEIKPVNRGHRLALTYNLLAEGDTTAGDVDAERLDTLTEAVREHFAQPRHRADAPPREAQPREAPMKMVYLLDHEYTGRDLSWKRLKNGDSRRAAALRLVAQRLDCEVYLALAEVHETWSCEEEDERGYGGYREYEYEDEDEDEGEEGPEGAGDPDLNLIELIDDHVELTNWIDAEGRKAEGSGIVQSEEMFCTTPSSDFKPFRSEHEGYMGNYGNTADRWYHRAALVMWPKSLAFGNRAKHSPRWAIRQVTVAPESGVTGKARDLVSQLLLVWNEAVRKDRTPVLLGMTLSAAARFGSPEVALALLAPFSLEHLTVGNIPRFVKTVQGFGPVWARGILKKWVSENRLHSMPEAWISKQLPNLCRALCAEGGSGGNGLAQEILDPIWKRISFQITTLRRGASKYLDRGFVDLISPLLGLLHSGRLTESREFQQRIVEFLSDRKTDLPVTNLVELLQAAHKESRHSLRDSGLLPLLGFCRTNLETLLNEPTRAKEDWSITPSLGCSCKLCVRLGRFLRSTGEKRLEWPLAKPDRQHLHQQIDGKDLPVLHATRRTGSPFTLILEKTEAVFTREVTARSIWKKKLAWLKSRE